MSCNVMFRTTLFLMLICLVCQMPAQAQADKGELQLTLRVNSSNNEVRSVLEIWQNYLASRPDSLYDNPYWTPEEKDADKEFDLTRTWVFFAPDIFQYFTPTVLSVEAESPDLYSIRTLFHGLNAADGVLLPMALHRVYARRNENGEWRLSSALPHLTADWQRRSIGRISFVYPPTHTFDKELARRANDYCNKVRRKFDLQDPGHIYFYICDSKDELARILGLDYYIRPVHGLVYERNGILLSGLGSEFYPHELVHVLFREFSDTHRFLHEGVATWLGGSLRESLDELVLQFAASLEDGGSFSFKRMLNNVAEESTTYYTVGGMLCREAYRRGGNVLLKRLLRAPAEEEEMLQRIEAVFDVPQSEFEALVVSLLPESVVTSIE